MQPESLLEGSSHVVAGIMSGTSLDGMDIAIVRVSRTDGWELEVLGFVTKKYPEWIRELLLTNSSEKTASLESITRLNVALGMEYADAVEVACSETDISPGMIDFIGSHGQTICHLPTPDGKLPAATLQIGDPSVIANLTGIPVVGDFRMADIAVGGQGAPLVPYFDHLMFSNADHTRVALNIGGIANITVLPAASRIEEIAAFDTGPGNMVMDSLAKKFLGVAYDASGQVAASGSPDETTVAALLDMPYFKLPPPKSTGREDFGDHFAERLIAMAAENGTSRPEDLLATAAALTARSVRLACEPLFQSDPSFDRLIVGGGGTRNEYLMSLLEDAFAPVAVVTTNVYGIDPDAREAICFAVLAKETIDFYPSNVPSATGAARPAILGKICFP